jgi:hypothetical protein
MTGKRVRREESVEEEDISASINSQRPHAKLSIQSKEEMNLIIKPVSVIL